MKKPSSQVHSHPEHEQSSSQSTLSEKIKNILKTINIFDILQQIHALEKENERLMKIIKQQQEIIRKKDEEIAKQEKNLPYLKYQTEEEKKKKYQKKKSWREEREQDLIELEY